VGARTRIPDPGHLELADFHKAETSLSPSPASFQKLDVGSIIPAPQPIVKSNADTRHLQFRVKSAPAFNGVMKSVFANPGIPHRSDLFDQSDPTDRKDWRGCRVDE
jgi:hypothetical protein